MNEKELEKKRKEFRDGEIQKKISSYQSSDAIEYRESSLKTHYTYKRVDKNIGKFGKGLIIFQAVSLFLFCSLYVFTYIPKMSPFVSKVLP
jgi:hypothetical protein